MSKDNGKVNGKTNAVVAFRKFAKQDAILERFADVLGERSARAYVGSVILAVANSEHLQACTHVSIITAALQAASLRLSCDPQMKQAYLVPFKGRAVLIVGYKGLQDMAIRTGQYRSIHVHRLEHQRVEFDPLTGAARLETILGDKQPGYVASFQMVNGFAKSVYMTVEEIHDHAKQYSAGYARKDGAWQTNPEAMERKTVLRRLLSQWGYLDPADAATLHEIEDREYMDPAEIGGEGDFVAGIATDLEEEDDDPVDVEEMQRQLGFG